MSRLVHLTRASRARACEKAGIRGARHILALQNGPTTIDRAVFAMPVTPEFATTHQWLRELRRAHRERMVAVHFALHRDEIVHVGRYGQTHWTMPLTEAVAWVRANPMGAEVIVPRSIRPREIVAVREIGQLVGWIEYPESQGHYDCVCRICLPSGVPDRFRRIQAAYQRAIDAARAAPTGEAAAHALRGLDAALESARGRISPAKIIPFTRHPDAAARAAAVWVLGYFHRTEVEDVLTAMLDDADERVWKCAVESLISVSGVNRTNSRLAARSASARAEFASQLPYLRDDAVAMVVLCELLKDQDQSVREAAARAIEEITATV